VLNCKDSIDGYLAYKSLMKQKKRPRTNDLRMFLTIEEVFDYYFTNIILQINLFLFN
jgi:hypothetical protein